MYYQIELPKHLVVDHINCNTWDNRKENLRLVTPSYNSTRQQGKSGNKSKYQRVSFSRHANKYMVTMVVKGERIHIGYYKDEVEAAYWADVWAVRLYIDDIKLNFPDNIQLYEQEALLLNCVRPWNRPIPQPISL
jgi:hypothetical protein